MDFKFWGAAPGGFFENPTIFDVFGLVFSSSGVPIAAQSFFSRIFGTLVIRKTVATMRIVAKFRAERW